MQISQKKLTRSFEITRQSLIIKFRIFVFALTLPPSRSKLRSLIFLKRFRKEFYSMKKGKNIAQSFF